MKQTEHSVLAAPPSSTDLITARRVEVRKKDVDTTRLPVADILRGLAALWVFLFHASEGQHIEGVFNSLPPNLAGVVFSAGHLGVAVFFVLSGLVIAMSAERSGNGIASAPNFLARRLVRLAPPYYVSLVVVLAFLLLKNKVEATGAVLPDATSIAAHLLFSQDLLGIHALNTVYWTLCIEIQFYFVFCVLMLLTRRLEGSRLAGHAWLTVVGAACTIAAVWPLGLAADDATWHSTFLPTWHLFLLGILLHRALKRDGNSVVPYVAYLATLTVAALVSSNVFTLAGVATSIVLYGLSHWPAESLWKRFSLLTKLGLISYSFYLLHNPITGAAFNVTRRLVGNGVAAELTGLAFSFFLCVIAAWISYLVIERPAIRWAQRFRN